MQIYDLPIVFIDTKGRCLNSNVTKKIAATIKVLDGKTNNVADSSKATRYDIGIKVRGSLSRAFPKPNYSIEFHDSTGKDINVSLFGLPPSDDWILHGPYVDKSHIETGVTTVEIPGKARKKAWIATLNGKMMNR